MKPPRWSRNDTLFLALILAALGLAFVTGFLSRTFLDAQTARYPLLDQVVALIRDNGLTDLPGGPALEYGMIQGVIQAYHDPYTTFLEPVQAELQDDQLQGHYGGIGARLERDAAGSLLLYPFPDSPAAKAGIREGERLLAVSGLEVGPQTALDAVQAALRGKVGTQVALTLAAPGGAEARQVTLVRAEVALPSTSWNLAPGEPRVGVIHASVIAATTPAELGQAVADLQARGATHFVLDLRDNGGGLLEAGVDTARLFLHDGTVIQQQYRGRPVETFDVTQPGALEGIPLAVLINHNTASAAEIVAGALQAHRRALLVGRPSYGKDTIQLIFDLKDGSSLHVTAAHWWIPGLEGELAGKGLQPDVSVAEDAGDAAFLEAAIGALLK